MQTNNKPVTNPELVKAIKIMQEQKTINAQNAMIDELLNARLLAPVSVENTSDSVGEDVVLKENTSVKIFVLENANKQKFLPAFTDWYELTKWKNNEDPKTLIINFDTYAKMLLEGDGECEGFVIDPFGVNLLFTKEIMERIKQVSDARKKDNQLPTGEGIHLGLPKIYPTDLMDTVKEVLQKHDSVEEAYIQMMVKNEEQTFLIVVKHQELEGDLFQEIGSAARPYLKEIGLNVVSMDTAFGKESTKDIAPFYKK